MKKSFLFFAILTIAIFLVYYLCSGFDVAYILAKKEYLNEHINNRYWFSLMVFIGACIVTVVAGLPIIALLGMTGGLLFGVYVGSAALLLGGVLGAIISFVAIKYFVGHYIQDKYKDRLEKFSKNFEKYGARYLVMLHIMMVVPFFIINTFAAVTHVSFFTFLWTTIVGLFPVVVLYSYAGNQLNHIQSISDIFTWPIILSISAIIMLILFSILKDKLKLHHH